MNLEKIVIADASNDSWTEGDPEMKKENLVSHEEKANRRRQRLLMKRQQQQKQRPPMVTYSVAMVVLEMIEMNQLVYLN